MATHMLNFAIIRVKNVRVPGRASRSAIASTATASRINTALSLLVKSVSNLRESWMKRIKKVKLQRCLIMYGRTSSDGNSVVSSGLYFSPVGSLLRRCRIFVSSACIGWVAWR
jgi:hypothetical protein